MPIIEVEIPDEVMKQLEAYCGYYDETPSNVVTKALMIFFEHPLSEDYEMPFLDLDAQM